MVASKNLKLAAKSQGSQQAVWDNVRIVQRKLSENVGTTVNSTVSETSLELSVENTRVKESIQDYIKALSGITDSKSDVIGYVFAINGQVNSADIYASRSLFIKLWPKLLKANATEALAEVQSETSADRVTSASVKAFLSEAERAAPSKRSVSDRVDLVTREDAKNVFYETQDRDKNGSWVHRNYIRKD